MTDKPDAREIACELSRCDTEGISKRYSGHTLRCHEFERLIRTYGDTLAAEARADALREAAEKLVKIKSRFGYLVNRDVAADAILTLLNTPGGKAAPKGDPS